MPALGHETEIDGTWKGKSVCQVKRSGCRDEAVVYTARQSGPDSHEIFTYRIEAGRTVRTGRISGYYTDARTFTAWGPDSWIFTIKGDHMSGRIVSPRGRLLRVIEVDRIK